MLLGELLAELHKRGIEADEMTLRNAHRYGKLPKPQRMSSGRFIYSAEDLERAAEFFLARSQPADASSCS